MDHSKMDKLARAEFVKRECEDAVERALTDFPVTHVPQGATTLPERTPGDPAKVRPETCGCGGASGRAPTLSEEDGDYE